MLIFIKILNFLGNKMQFLVFSVVYSFHIFEIETKSVFNGRKFWNFEVFFHFSLKLYDIDLVVK